MDNDQLAATFKACFDAAHAATDALADGSAKTEMQRRLNLAHGHMNHLLDLSVGAGIIQPLSGGDPKP